MNCVAVFRAIPIQSTSQTYPDIARLRLSTFCLEITDYFGRVQRLRIVWIPTYFGRHRAILVCGSCGCGAIRLFARYGTYACRHCHKAVYTSQKHDQNGRQRLAASKLLLQLGGLQIFANQRLPSPNGTRRRTYQRIRNEIQALEATAKTRRFRKPISNTALRLSRCMTTDTDICQHHRN
jgi:hypothetical protein